ncbi:PNPLA domain-containing protein [Caenorhabditis elegans]|uniref:PNPLA domain-containing protein n=1 Tax=Caenorhabditis elegans TaxID=6239 RepID=Q9N5L3_CAEEL|nr:PNPLA domain-containing protein [Caenorhabditis elegans]CCD68981.1 PNPLA domain-containing protein [Caenorhabditis elegans]|eukprot:NP_501497.2 Intracelllar PhosphoLipase A family [Caenorhabditis elegans]
MFSDVLKRINAQEIYKRHIDIFHAITYDNIDGLVAAFVRNEPFDIKDKNGNTPLHLAAKLNRRLLCRAVCVYAAGLDLWNSKNNDGKTPIEMTDDANIKRDLQSISTSRSSVDSHHMAYNKLLIEKKINENEEQNQNQKVILSLDGGGLRVVLQCAILLAVERELGEPLRNRIHWIAGTSCGGIMASSIGVGIDLADALRLYIIIRKRIFGGNNQKFPKHSALGIETCLQEVMGSKTLMSKCTAHRLVVTTAKVTLAPPQLVLFRSYAPRIDSKEFEQLGYFNPNKILLWKAIRCTTAAPTYFPSFNGMADGALFCNNPCIMVMTEFAKLKKIENYRGKNNTDEIGCVISVGTGIEPSYPINGIDINLTSGLTGITGNWREIIENTKNLITVFLYQCTSSHNVHVGQSREWCHSMQVPFFRFSPHLAAPFELDNCKIEDITNAMFDNEVYIRTEIKQHISDLCRLLKSMPRNTEPCNYSKITGGKGSKVGSPKSDKK